MATMRSGRDEGLDHPLAPLIGAEMCTLTVMCCKTPSGISLQCLGTPGHHEQHAEGQACNSGRRLHGNPNTAAPRSDCCRIWPHLSTNTPLARGSGVALRMSPAANRALVAACALLTAALLSARPRALSTSVRER